MTNGLTPLKQKVAVVTGANRGIGFEVARQLIQQGFQVIMGCRDQQKGTQAAKSLSTIGEYDPYFIPLNIVSDSQVQIFCDAVLNRFGKIDILINNAAIYIDNPIYSYTLPLTEGSASDFLHTLDINVVGAFRMIKVVLPGMLSQNYGRIVNVSSIMGRFTQIRSYSSFYSISKASLNGLTIAVAHQCSNTNILINSVCPGWVNVGMGGTNGERSVEDGARSIVWAATLPNGGPSGNFFQDYQEISWS